MLDCRIAEVSNCGIEPGASASAFNSAIPQFRSSAIARRRSRRPYGFTLMEVVVAITLMALVMSVLLMGLRLGASALQRGQQKLDAKARALASVDVLQRQVAAAA